MSKYQTNSIGFELSFEGPSTVEEYDKAAGKVGLCLEDAVENTIYRGTLPKWHKAFAVKVEELTGVKREVNTKATDEAKARSKTPDKVADIMETVPRYVKRAIASMSDEDKKALAVIAQEVADGISVDPAPSERQRGIPKDLLAKADSVLTGTEDEIEAKVTRWSEMVPNFELERDEANKPTRESLAMLAGEVLKAM